MASFGAAALVCAFLALCLVVPNLATDYTVGESSGWALGSDYTTWTAGKTFKVGDTLAFNYGGGHTVDEVSASDYNSCTVGNALTSDSSGATTIALKTPGTHYFICGVVGHCGSGMKLAVTVAAAGSGTTPSSSTGTTPSSSGATPASPSTSTGTNTPVNKPASDHMPQSSSTILNPVGAIMLTLVSVCLRVLSL